MPIHDYQCAFGHTFERFFKTFKEAEGVNAIQCEKCLPCRNVATRVEFSVPSEGMFYGNPDGYAKPSATKRYSTKLVSSIEGNKSAVG